jgi:hypothetical protein
MRLLDIDPKRPVRTARKIDEKLGLVKGKKHPNITATMTGVAFFDPIRGQEGVAPNGIEHCRVLSRDGR